MSVDILQRFLNRRLFTVPDDQQLERLRASATDLATSLVADASPTVRYAAVAVDPEVGADEPVLVTVASAVEKRWNTYLRCFSDTPRMVYRAVLLEALRQAQEKDLNIALAVSLTCGNLIPQMDIGVEEGVWVDLLSAPINTIEDRANLDWSGDFGDLVPKFNLPKPSSAAPAEGAVVDRQVLLADMRDAAGSGGSRGRNPYWPHQQPQQWVEAFAKNATDAIADAIEKTVRAAVPSATEIGKYLFGSLSDFAGATEDVVRQTVEGIAGRAAGLQRRTALLWWKESLYSLSAHSSYRSFSQPTAAVLMALDLVDQIPLFCPQSVQFFLREAVKSLTEPATSSKKSPPKPVSDIVSELLKSDSRRVLSAVLEKYRMQTTGRRTLLEFLADSSAAGSADSGRLRAEVGIAASATLPYADLSVWIFREAQALRATLQT